MKPGFFTAWLLVFGAVVFFFPVLFAETLPAVPVCESGEEAFHGFGFDRLFLEWDSNSITSTACDAGDGNNTTGYFCDASQFSVMLFKRFEEFKEKVNSFVSDLNEEEKQSLFSVHSLQGVEEKTGINADLNAFLLKDNYSHQFVEDFDAYYGSHFFSSSPIDISKWVFFNTPRKSGLYRVKLDLNSLYFDGEKFWFSKALKVKFELSESLADIDERQHSHYSKNKWLALPFDALIGLGKRDYGSSLQGKAFYLNDHAKFSSASGAIAALNVEWGKSYNDTAAGIVFGLGAGEDSNHYYLKVNDSTPVVLSMYSPGSNKERFYYSLSDATGKPFPMSFFGERQFLFTWKSKAGEQFDYFSGQQLPRGLKCSGWNDPIPAAVLETESPGFESPVAYFALAFLPRETAISLQCVSSKAIFTLASYDSQGLGNYQTVTVLPGKWLSGKSLLKPVPWRERLSLKAAFEEVKKENMCVLANNKAILLSWNSGFFREKSNGLIQAAQITPSSLELCKLQPGDVLQVTNKKIREDAAKLYWCRDKAECKNEGGYTFYGKSFDPCSDSSQYCCYKPTAGSTKPVVAPESEKECLAQPMSLEFDYGEYGTPGPEFIEEILRTWPGIPSYALEDNRLGCRKGEEYKCSIGEAFVYFNTQPWRYRLGDGSTFIMKKKFDPLIPLAFFSYESKMGVDPRFDRRRKSIGNIEQKSGEAGRIQSTLCTNPVFGRFCGYKYWWESVRHWAWLMEANYASGGRSSIRDILYKYAPPSENDTEAYIKNVKRRVCHWRELWKEYRDRQGEETLATALRLPKIRIPLFKAPKWFTKRIPQITSFVKKYAMFWSWDKDNDGIPDISDKCPNQRETFNRYNDKDGCPDTVTQDYRSKRISSFNNSIKGKRVILFVPSDFDQSENAKFKNSAEKYFNKFLEISGLEKTAASGSLVMVAGNVLDYESVPACRSVRTTRSMTSLSNDRVLGNTRQFWLDLDKCGRDYLRKMYGTLPPYRNYRVVALINSSGRLWIKDRGGEFAIGGLSELGRREPKNHALSRMSARVVSHELGHTFGFGEQYSSLAYTKQAGIYRLKNYYAGPLQLYENFSRFNASWLYNVYPRASKYYPVCLYNINNKKTNCPDRTQASGDYSIDCSGRIISSSPFGEKRSVMGPEMPADFGFDCYEKKAIISQWGR